METLIITTSSLIVYFSVIWLTGPTEGKLHFNGNLNDLPPATFGAPAPIVNVTTPCAVETPPGEPWTGRTDHFGKPIITSSLAPFALKKTGAMLCKGGMVARGAPVDPECAAQMRQQFVEFAGLTFENARCENGHCIVEHVKKAVVVYSCDCEQMDNGTIIGSCKILAPFTLPSKAKEATLKAFIREEMYY